MSNRVACATAALAVGAGILLGAPAVALAAPAGALCGTTGLVEGAAECSVSPVSSVIAGRADAAGARPAEISITEPVVVPSDVTRGGTGMLLELWVASGVAAFAAGGTAVAVSVRRNRRLSAATSRA